MLTHSLGRLSRKEAMMSEQKEPVQADGKGTRKDAPDGVDQEEVSGRTGGVESGGGPYPIPKTARKGKGNKGANWGNGGKIDTAFTAPGGNPGTKKKRPPQHKGSQGAKRKELRTEENIPQLY